MATAKRKPPTPQTSTTVRAEGLRVQPYDDDGTLLGEPAHVPGVATVDLGSFEPDDTGIELPGLAPGATLEFATDDPATVETVRQLARIPVPTAVIVEWWPAFFRPPAEPEPWRLCKVFLTPQGLYVYRTPPKDAETFTNGALPSWYSPVDFEKTPRPVTGYAALNAGIPIETAAGRVNVQPSPGCGCSARSLKNWTPPWSRNRISWTDALVLADVTAGR